MTDNIVSKDAAVQNPHEEHNMLALASEQPRFGSLYGRACQLTTDTEMLDLLPRCFGLSQESQELMRNVVLVSIDLERAKYSKIREIGISTLDLQVMKEILAAPGGPRKSLPPVRNYNFRIQEKYRFEQPYIFGDTVNIEHEEVLGLIQRVCSTGNPMDFSHDTRNVVIIGHSFYFDQKLFASNNINLPELDILDTCLLAQNLFKDKIGSDRPEDFQLKSLLQHFKIQGDHFHVAGNDSNFTLKLLLVLVVMSSQDQTISEEQQATVSAVIEIAYAPWPPFSWKSKREQDLELTAEVQNNKLALKAEHLDPLGDDDSSDIIMDIFGEQY